MAVTRIEEGGLGTDSFNLPVTLNGTDGSSTHAGDNIILDASASGVGAGERLLYEGIPPDIAGNFSSDVNVLSGATLTIDSGATIVNSGTATGFGSNTPSSADGQALGSTSAEWSDLYLADGSVIYFGNDQDIKLTHSADSGLLLKHVATADDKPINLVLQTGETDMAADDVMGKISFQAPDEGTGTDAILVAAAIQARAEGNFSSSSNATSLDFFTGNSAAAGSDGGSLILGSTGNLTLKDLRTADGSSPTLTLQTGDTDIASSDVLGKIAFQAPDEGAGTDAILVAGAIQVVSEGNFAADNNAVSMEFHLAASEAAATKALLTSTGVLKVGAGAVGSPSLSFLTDPDTGIFSLGGDEIGIAVGGSRPIYSSNRKVCINDQTTANMSSGLTINQTSYDDEIFALKSSDIAHGYTGIADTDTYLWIKKHHASAGGVTIFGANESGGNVGALNFSVHNDTYSNGHSTGGNCGSHFFFYDGENSDIDADGNLLGIICRRGGSNELVWMVDEDGDIHADGSLSAYDEYDDAMLARAMQIELSGQELPEHKKTYGKVIQTEFDSFVKYNKQTLIDAELLGETTEEEEKEGHRGLINVTGLQRLHNGAIVQQRAMFETMKSVVEEMLPGFSEKLNERLEAQSLPALPV